VFEWAAGLYEGEGSVGLSRAGKDKAAHVRDVRMTVSSTDRDVLERFLEVVGVGKIVALGRRPSALGAKQQFQWKLSRQAQVADLLWRFFPHLGERRTRQALEVLAYIYRDRSKPWIT
jgi:hypothetical protein